MALAPSVLSPQTELLKDDLDLKSLNLSVKGRASLAILEHVTDAQVQRTIEGASTLTVTVRDRERLILQSGYLAEQVDTEVDGLWFRFKAFGKQGDDLTLTFEDREVAVLRDYPKPGDPHAYLVRSALTTTRIQFAKMLVDEVRRELPGIRFVTPDSFGQLLQDAGKPLDSTTRTHARGYGFAPGAKITVKHKAATPEQLANIDAVLQTGVQMKARRKVLVVSVMAITVESLARNLPGGDRDSIGILQQRPSQGWGTPDQLRSVVYQATKFFEAAISDDRKNPHIGYGELAQDVQVSATPDAYDLWRDEAEATVNAWGATGTDTALQRLPITTDGSFQFTRGTQTVQNGKKKFTREDNWSCLQRLAQEVQWRCFAVSGTVYFMPDLDLLASQPLMTLSEKTPGVDSIDGNFDEGRRSRRKGHRVQLLNQAVTIPCRIGRWQAPPGTAVELEDMGPFDGRWLVATIARGLFTPDGTITVKRPQPALPEAQAPEYLQTGGAVTYVPSTTGAVTPDHQYVAAGSLVQPIPKEFALGHGKVHATLGLETYLAIDFFAHPGSPVIAPEGGKITRFSGHDPALGPIGAPGGPLGWSIYLEGDSGTSYYLTHLDTRTCKVGDTVILGQQIATVADYDKWGRQSHTHVGVNGGTVTIEMLGGAPLAESVKATPAERHHHR